VKFCQTVRVVPGDARVVARLAGGTPLLVEKQVGEGRVLLFASTFDNTELTFRCTPRLCHSWNSP
jgi:hypothetical protein